MNGSIERLKRRPTRILALLALGGMLSPISTLAADAPLAGSPFYFQTSGPSAGLTVGDWYTSTAGGNGYHYFNVSIPCPGPTAAAIHVDIFSPAVLAGSTIDETRGAADSTQFEFYAAGTAPPGAPPYNTPGPGAGGSVAQTTFAPAAGADAWVRFYTLPAGSACGIYLLRAATTGDDDNSWRLRVSGDNDGDPTTAPPTSADPGIVLGMLYSSLQQGTGATQCISTYEILPAGPSTLHNFDIDGNTSVTYFPLRTGASVAGTVSTDSSWNVGTGAGPAPRDGDLINVAANQAGYWRMETCVSSGNGFVQEGVTSAQSVFELPLSMSVAKTDLVTTAQMGGYLSYTITFTNTSGLSAGVAKNVTIVDTIPTNSTFDGASVNAPFTGTCTGTSVVTCTITGNVAAGVSGTVTVSVLVNNPAAGTTVVNNATLDFQDLLNAQYPQLSASDTDQLPSLRLVKTSNCTVAVSTPGVCDTVQGPQVGDIITYTLTVSNPTAVAQTSVVVNDPLPAGTSYVANSTVAASFALTKTFADDFNPNGYGGSDGNTAWTGAWTEVGGEGDGSGAGTLNVTANAMQVGDNSFVGTQEGLRREANLVIAGGTSCTATLAFNVRQIGLDAGEEVVVAISGNGGSSFTPLETFTNALGGAFVPRSYNVSGSTATNTVVQFLTNGSLETGEYLEVDSVSLTNSCTGGPKNNLAPGGAFNSLSSGVPPTLVQAADGLSLAPSASATVTFQVQVTVAGPIVNIATATSAQDSDPAEGYVRDVGVTRASLAGVRVSGGVVEFATSWQLGTRGFNLYSAATRLRRADKVLINPEFIRSPRPDSMTPILYRATAQVTGPFLWIEEVELGNDSGRLMGPFSVDDQSLRLQFERVEQRLAGASRDDHRGSRSLRRADRPRGKAFRKVSHGPRRVASTGVKIEVVEAGLVQLSWTDLLEEGMPQRFARDGRSLRVTNLGTNVPFTSNDAGLSFVSRDLVTEHTARNVYVISWSGVPAVTTQPVRSEPEVQPGQFRVQKNWIYYGMAPLGSDPWLWDALASGDPWPVDWDPSQGDFDLPGFTGGAGRATVRIEFLGRSETEHQIEASMNGVSVGHLTFFGANAATLEGSVPRSALRASGNHLTLTYSSPGEAGSSFVYLNYLDLGINLPTQTADLGRIAAFDATLPRLDRADYLIVTHSDFQAQAERIANLKNRGKRSAVVVDVERAYDAFTGGVPDPAAVKALIAEARRASTVLLIGDDTIDPADNYAIGERVFMPSAIGFDQYTGRVASENLYADRNGDGIPDLAIGRLAVRTAAEADAMVEKIENAESLLAANLGRHIIAVDNQGLNDMPFRSEGRAVEAMLRGPTTFADIALGSEAARNVLLDALTAGALTTTYIGHGAPDYWADEGIFGSADAALFANTNQGTMLLTWACVSSDYLYFYGPSVSEAMTLVPRGGAVASFGPTGISLPTLQRELYLRLYPKLLAGLSLGEAVRQTKGEMLLSHPGEGAFLHGWVLLGDPDVYLPR